MDLLGSPSARGHWPPLGLHYADLLRTGRELVELAPIALYHRPVLVVR